MAVPADRYRRKIHEAEFRRLWDANMRPGEIAKALGVSDAAIAPAARRLKLRKRNLNARYYRAAVSFWVTDAQFDWLYAQARAQGMDMSTLLRGLVEQAATTATRGTGNPA